MTIAIRQSQTSSIGCMYVRAHIYQHHPLFATRRIVAPRLATYTDTIVEISITVSLAINPISRAVHSDTILWLPDPFGSRRDCTRLREAGQADVALIYLRNCLARCCLRNYDNVTISRYYPKESSSHGRTLPCKLGDTTVSQLVD